MKGEGGRKHTWAQETAAGRLGCPPHHLWLRRGPGLLLLSLAWLAAGQEGGERRAVGGCPLGEASPLPTRPPPAKEPQPLLQAGRALPGASPMASHPGVGRTGQVGPAEAAALATGPLAGLIVGRAIPRWGAGGQILHFHCNSYIRTRSIK